MDLHHADFRDRGPGQLRHVPKLQANRRGAQMALRHQQGLLRFRHLLRIHRRHPPAPLLRHEVLPGGDRPRPTVVLVRVLAGSLHSYHGEQPWLRLALFRLLFLTLMEACVAPP